MPLRSGRRRSTLSVSGCSTRNVSAAVNAEGSRPATEAAAGPERSGSDVLLHPLDELALRERAHLGRGDGAVLEQHQGRDAAHAVLGGGERVVVDIDLDDLHLLAEVAVHVLEVGGDHLAGAAPLGPEVDEDRLVGLEDVLVEARVGRLDDGHGLASDAVRRGERAAMPHAARSVGVAGRTRQGADGGKAGSAGAAQCPDDCAYGSTGRASAHGSPSPLASHAMEHRATSGTARASIRTSSVSATAEPESARPAGLRAFVVSPALAGAAVAKPLASADASASFLSIL